MSCSYRIIKPLHIGVSVRKTKDKTTVPFANEPLTGLKIEQASPLGYSISHPDLPKKIWVEFDQLDITELTSINGVIQDEITFVENIVGTSKIYFTKTDTDEYRELIADKEEKEELIMRKVSDLKPGDRCMSALCTDGTEMIFLGIMQEVTMSLSTYYGYSYGGGKSKCFYYPTQVKRAVFLTQADKERYSLTSYPVSNKAVKEILLMSDYRDNDIFHQEWSDVEKNARIIEEHDITGWAQGKYDNEKKTEYSSNLDARHPLIKPKYEWSTGRFVLFYPQVNKVDEEIVSKDVRKYWQPESVSGNYHAVLCLNEKEAEQAVSRSYR